MKKETDFISLDPLWSMLLAVAGFLVGVGIMSFDAWASARSRSFMDSFSGRFWILLIGAQTAFWAVVAIPLWSGLRRFRETFRQELRGSLLRIVLFAGIFLALLFAAPRATRLSIDNPLVGHVWKINLLTAISALAIAIPALVGMFWVRVLASSFDPKDEAERDSPRYLLLRDSLHRLLQLVGAVVALSTLGTGALRQALFANGRADAATFPPEGVLLWGAGATILVMLAYVPAYVTLRAAGQRLVMQLLPMPPLGTESWFAWNSKRKELNDFLQLDRNLGDQLQASIFILAPLLSAALSLAIPRQS